MLKITLSNGVIIEGDSADEVGNVLNMVIHNELQKQSQISVSVQKPVPAFDPLPELEPESEPELATEFPHHYATAGCKRTVSIGEREDQTLQFAKLICEEERNRSHEFKTIDVFNLVDNAKSSWVIGSSLQSLKSKGLVRHGSHRRCWVITERGWNSYYRVTMPMYPVRPTT